MALAMKKPQGLDLTRRRKGAALVRGVYTLWLKHMRKFWGSKLEIGATLFTPLLWMLLFGVCMGQTAQDFNRPGANLTYIAFITPGVMLLTGLSAAVLGGSTLLLERLNGTLQEYLIAPVPRLAILLGTVASGLTKAMFQAGLVLLLGLALGTGLAGGPGALLAGLVMIVLYALGFVGVAAASAIKARSMESYHSLILLLNLPVLFVSNALYPLEKMPEVIRGLAYLNPTTYAVDATRHLFFGAAPEIGLGLDLAVLGAFAALGLSWGYLTFRQATNRIAG